MSALAVEPGRPVAGLETRVDLIHWQPRRLGTSVSWGSQVAEGLRLAVPAWAQALLMRAGHGSVLQEQLGPHCQAAAAATLGIRGHLLLSLSPEAGFALSLHYSRGHCQPVAVVHLRDATS